MDIGYRIGGQGFVSGRNSVVFIHGAGGSAMSWLGALSALSRRINTIALDLPGHGDTPGPGLDSIDAYAAWLTKAMDFLGERFPELAPGKYLLAGHSMGGAIAQTVALSQAKGPAGLVLIGAGSRLKVAPVIFQGLENDFPQAVELIINFAFHQTDEDMRARSRELMVAAGAQVMTDDFTACDRFDVTARLGRISLPCLVLVGDNDKLTPVKYAEALARALPKSRMEVIAGAGHMVMVEQANALVRLIADFADEVFEKA